MLLPSISLLTICGIDELAGHREARPTHVLSILDPDRPDPEAFAAYGPHRRTVLRFHDAIEPGPGLVLPTPRDMEAILAFGASVEDGEGGEGHLVVHCHMGISRSTAAMTALLARSHPGEDEDRLFARLLAIRAHAWPNSLMIGEADRQLARGGRLTAALGRLYRRQLEAFPRFDVEMNRLGRGREVEMGRAA